MGFGFAKAGRSIKKEEKTHKKIQDSDLKICVSTFF